MKAKIGSIMGTQNGDDLFLNYCRIEGLSMLAIFTNLLDSKKISGPRLELRLTRPLRSFVGFVNE